MASMTLEVRLSRVGLVRGLCAAVLHAPRPVQPALAAVVLRLAPHLVAYELRTAPGGGWETTGAWARRRWRQRAWYWLRTPWRYDHDGYRGPYAWLDFEVFRHRWTWLCDEVGGYHGADAGAR